MLELLIDCDCLRIRATNDFLRIYSKDVSFESPATPGIFGKQWQPKVNVDLNTKSDKFDDKGNYEVTSTEGTRRLSKRCRARCYLLLPMQVPQDLTNCLLVSNYDYCGSRSVELCQC